MPEAQIHRVDHFLGRATVLNLFGARFANHLFEPLWNRDHIDHVDIVFDEQLTLENRARYYDSAGALMDMIQSHLLQILALVAMEPIATVEALEVRDAKAQVLRACRVSNNDPLAAAKRARYTKGSIRDGRSRTTPMSRGSIPSQYRDSGRTDRRDRQLALGRGAFPAAVGQGAPRPAERRPGDLQAGAPPADRDKGTSVPNRLRLSMGPDAIALEINVNGPGDPLDLESVVLGTDLSPGRLPAYGEVLAGVLDGDPLLAVRGDTAEQCWRIVDPVLQAWRENRAPMEEYAAGSTDPTPGEPRPLVTCPIRVLSLSKDRHLPFDRLRARCAFWP